MRGRTPRRLPRREKGPIHTGGILGFRLRGRGRSSRDVQTQSHIRGGEGLGLDFHRLSTRLRQIDLGRLPYRIPKLSRKIRSLALRGMETIGTQAARFRENDSRSSKAHGGARANWTSLNLSYLLRHLNASTKKIDDLCTTGLFENNFLFAKFLKASSDQVV